MANYTYKKIGYGMEQGLVNISSNPITSSRTITVRITGGELEYNYLGEDGDVQSIKSNGYTGAGTYTLPEDAVRGCIFIDPENESLSFIDGRYAGPSTAMNFLDGNIYYYDGVSDDVSSIPLSGGSFSSSNLKATGTQTFFGITLPAEWNVTGLSDLGISNPLYGVLESFSANGINLYYSGMPVFFDPVEARNYAKTGILPDNPTEEDPWGGAENPTGDTYGETDFNTIDNDAVLSRTLLLTKGNMERIGELLYTDTDQPLWEQIFDGLSKQYTASPLSFIIDCFYLPFNPHKFIQSSVTATSTNFGPTSVSIGTHQVIKSQKVATVANVILEKSFFDFRDYMGQNIYINLPYAGIYPIDIERYLGFTFKVKAYFDIRTGEIKYYLCKKDTVLDMYTGSVRMNLPLMSTDVYQASREKLSSAVSIAGAAAGLATGNAFAVGSVIASAGGIMNNALDLAKEPNRHSSGGFSSATGLVDTKDIYLIIEQTEISYPENLRATYGMPDNKVEKVGNFTGFVQVDDIILKSSARESLKEKAITALKEGVFV